MGWLGSMVGEVLGNAAGLALVLNGKPNAGRFARAVGGTLGDHLEDWIKEQLGDPQTDAEAMQAADVHKMTNPNIPSYIRSMNREQYVLYLMNQYLLHNGPNAPQKDKPYIDYGTNRDQAIVRNVANPTIAHYMLRNSQDVSNVVNRDPNVKPVHTGRHYAGKGAYYGRMDYAPPKVHRAHARRSPKSDYAGKGAYWGNYYGGAIGDIGGSILHAIGEHDAADKVEEYGGLVGDTIENTVNKVMGDDKYLAQERRAHEKTDEIEHVRGWMRANLR